MWVRVRSISMVSVRRFVCVTCVCRFFADLVIDTGMYLLFTTALVMCIQLVYLAATRRQQQGFVAILIRYTIGTALAMGPYLIAAIAFGLPVTDPPLLLLTLFWAALVASLSAGPIVVDTGFSSDDFRRLAIGFQPNNKREVLSLAGAMGTLGGVWLSCAAIPLDWDRPWQKWPIPAVFGAFFGYAAGVVIAAGFCLPRGCCTKAFAQTNADNTKRN